MSASVCSACLGSGGSAWGNATCPECDGSGSAPEVGVCPLCGSADRVTLGTLGRLRHYRCRDCGIDYN